MKTKILYATVLILCLLSSTAYSEGFIVKKTEPKYKLLLKVPEGEQNLGNGYYYTESAEGLLNDDTIVRIFKDETLELFEYPQTTNDAEFERQWALKYINADKARRAGLTGKGVKIAIIDSGVANHTDLLAVQTGYNCIANARDSGYLDTYGHGTVVAGIIAAKTDNENAIAGIAPDAQIIPLKVTNGSGLMLSSLIKAINRALNLHVDIINMSLGANYSKDSAAAAALSELMETAEKQGVIVCAAAGNEGSSAMNYPAACENVIGVGNITQTGKISDSSQKNESVFVAAPGTDIVSLFCDGKTATKSGTSFSTPMVTAAAALVKQAMPDCTPEQFRSILKSTVIDAGSEGYDTSYGYGILDIGKITELLRDKLPEIVLTEGEEGGNRKIHLHNNGSNSFMTVFTFTDKLGNIKKEANPDFSSGVSNFVFGEKGSTLYLWKDNLKPVFKPVTNKTEK